MTITVFDDIKFCEQKEGIILKKNTFELSPLVVWIALWIVNI